MYLLHQRIQGASAGDGNCDDTPSESEVADCLRKVSASIKPSTDALRRNVCLYLRNRATEGILLRPVKEALQDAVSSIRKQMLAFSKDAVVELRPLLANISYAVESMCDGTEADEGKRAPEVG